MSTVNTLADIPTPRLDRGDVIFDKDGLPYPIDRIVVSSVGGRKVTIYFLDSEGVVRGRSNMTHEYATPTTTEGAS